MSTCKDLRRHGVRIILGEDRAIAFWTLSDVRSLTAFMNSNVPEGTGGRSAHIRMVDLASKVQQWTHDQIALNRLVDLLKQATNLYALSVNHTFFRFSSVAQSMCASPSPFRSLRRLRLESPNRINLATAVPTAAGAQQVNPATSPYFLEKLVGIPLEVVIVSSFQSRRAELIGQLYRFRETLQELHFEETNLFLVPGAFNVTVIFPKLRVLSVTHSSNLALPRHTDTLIEMFPNIQSLAFSVPASTRTGRAAAGFAVHPNAPLGWQAIPFDGENALVPAPHTHTTIRDGNESGQRVARWNTLSYYQGSLEQLYMLAVRSHVEQLKITDLALTSTRVEWMHVVVRELAPTKLCLVLTVPDPVPDNADVELINLMPRDPTRPLRYLEIQLLNWPVEGEKLQVRVHRHVIDIANAHDAAEPTSFALSRDGDRTHARDKALREGRHEVQEPSRRRGCARGVGELRKLPE